MPMNDVTTLGFLGLGKMGSAIAARLLACHGVELHLYDPVAECMDPLVARGATAHADAAGVADVAEILFADCRQSQ